MLEMLESAVISDCTWARMFGVFNCGECIKFIKQLFCVFKVGVRNKHIVVIIRVYRNLTIM